MLPDLSSDLFSDTVRSLERHPESLRIKKLLFCLCNQAWENDAEILNRVPLEVLIKKVVQMAPTLEESGERLGDLVKKLNHSKVYQGVAGAIIEEFKRLYHPTKISQAREQVDGQETGLDRKANRSLGPISIEDSIEKIAEEFNNNRQCLRIKRIIIFICRDHWEEDFSVLNSYNLQELIWELIQVCPTVSALKSASSKIIVNPERQELYQAIYGFIRERMGEIYVRLNSFKKSEKRESNGETNLLERPELETTQGKSTPAGTYDPFKLRLEIMQSANPLRAKILLFSILYYPWTNSKQDGAVLRIHSLDNLLEKLLSQNQTLTRLKTQLYAVAQSLPNADEQMQTARAILEAIETTLSFPASQLELLKSQ